LDTLIKNDVSWEKVHDQYFDLLKNKNYFVEVRFKYFYGDPESRLEIGQNLFDQKADLIFIMNEHDFINIPILLNINTVCQDLGKF